MITISRTASARCVRVLAGSLLVAGSALAPALAPAASAASAATTSAATTSGYGRCSVFDYVGHGAVTSFHPAPVVTHATQLGIGPGVTHTVTKTASHQRTVSVHTSGSVEVSGSASWLWGSVSAKAKASVARGHSHTSTASVSVTDTVTNRTGRNQAFVAYEGVTQYTGRYYTTYCKADTSSGIGDIQRHYGSYLTYHAAGSGIVWCRGGKPTALIAAAIDLYCH